MLQETQESKLPANVEEAMAREGTDKKIVINLEGAIDLASALGPWLDKFGLDKNVKVFATVTLSVPDPHKACCPHG